MGREARFAGSALAGLSRTDGLSTSAVMIFDPLTHLDGFAVRELSYRRRRQLLDDLELDDLELGGRAWSTPRTFRRSRGPHMRRRRSRGRNALVRRVYTRTDATRVTSSHYRPRQRLPVGRRLRLLRRVRFRVRARRRCERGRRPARHGHDGSHARHRGRPAVPRRVRVRGGASRGRRSEPSGCRAQGRRPAFRSSRTAGSAAGPYRRS